MPQNNVVSKEEIHFRGMFMSLFIDIEFRLGDILSIVLVGDNELKLNIIEFVNPKLMLEPKITLLNNILNKKYNNIHIQYKDDLDKLRKYCNLRNSFAHKRIEIDLNNKNMYFLNIFNGIESRDGFTYLELETKFNELKGLMSRFNELHNKLIVA